MKQTKAEKIIDARIDRVYRRHCSGVQVNIMDIPKIFAVGHKAIADMPHITDDQLAIIITGYVATICKN